MNCCIDCNKSVKYGKRCHSCANIYNWKDYDKRPNISFNTINNEIQSYILGLLASDGNIHKTTISLASKDLEIIKIFSNFFESPIKNYDLYRSGFKSRRISNELKLLGLNERKSTTKGLDKLFDNIPNSLKRHFIRGFMDGDGSIANEKSRYTVKFYNTDKKLLMAIRKNINPTNSYFIGRPKKHQIVYELGIIRKENFFKIYHLLYDNVGYYLSRKKIKFLQVKEFEFKHGQKGISKSLAHRKKISLSKTKYDKILTKQFLTEQLKNKSGNRISQEIGCSDGTVYNYMRKYSL